MAKKIVFSQHALDQLKKRKITKKSVKETIKNPKNKAKSFRGRELRQRVFNDKMLEVVIFESKELIDVITQYYLEEENED